MSMKTTILVTGACGYIGSHTCVELLNAGYAVVALDNLTNSSYAALAQVEKITACTMPFYKADVRDRALLDMLLREHRIDAALHFAGLKAVGESVAQPLAYFDNNVSGTISLLQALQAAGVRRLLFSSSATVYGNPGSVPIAEDAPLRVTNPYGRTKLMIEQILADVRHAQASWAVGVLRYFNPAGAHSSGLIGEDPQGPPNNLMPFVSQVASRQRERLKVFGNDYPTADGTGVRDYIHVVDLARGHVAALNYLLESGNSLTVNLGTGQGYSVLEVIRAFEAASGRSIPYEIAARRCGDIATCYANPFLAKELLGWQAEKGLSDMCADHWKWQCMNPQGWHSENTYSS